MASVPKEGVDPLAVQRGIYSFSLPGPLLFASLRALTGPAQWLLINAHPLSRFNVPRPPTGGTISIPLLSHEPLPRFPFMMAALPAFLSMKHIFWVSYLCKERMTIPFGFFGGFADLVYESITSLVFTAAAINPLFSDTFFYAGSAIYLTAVLAELTCELQRYAFKAKPENKGKLCKTGLWGLCRHPNYAANIVFGFGYGLMAGGPVYSLATGGMYLSNLALNATPGHEDYCAKKYGDEWEKYKKQVPWKLFPGIY